MSKAKVDERALRTLDGRRNAMWSAMRKLRNWTVVELQAASGVKDMGMFLDMLRRAKIVSVSRKVVRDDCAVWELIDDRGKLAPRVDIAGKPLPPTEHERLWYAMKALGSFDLPGLAAAAEVEPERARPYLARLVKARYLEAIRTGGTVTSYSLMPRMWTGRRPPEIHRDGVYDPNLGRMMTGAA